jgi:hypothetical protein
MDIDHIRPDELPARLPLELRDPSIVVDSGHGVHAYWLLADAFDVSRAEERDAFENMLRNLSASVGADTTTHDVSRLLRLPFLNMKDCRNGAIPVPCRLLHCDSSQVYPIEVFGRWWTHEGSEADQQRTETSLASEEFRSRRTTRRIRGLVRHLDADVPDRSRRDWGVVCGLLRLGVSEREIRTLVQGHSKFAGNEQYLETTLKKAQAKMNEG